MHEVVIGFGVSAVALLAVLGWGVFAYASPYRACRWCRAFPRLLGRRCFRCKGTKHTRRLGAKTAHKVALSLRQAREERGGS